MHEQHSLATLSDNALLEETLRRAKASKTAAADLIEAIAHVEARRLYVGAGYSSLYTYCTGALYLSEDEAYPRMEAARAALDFPLALEWLRDGSLTQSSLCLLAPYLTAENHQALLSDARFKTKREVQAQIEALRPGSPALYELRLYVPLETLKKLDRARDLLQHVVRNREVAEVIDRALDSLLRDFERNKLAATDRPRDGAEESLSRYIPTGARRKVWKRDGGRCAFVGTDGRCTETAGLEFHHLRPYAVGGPTSAANLELRCRTHNQREAEVYFERPTPR